jgi:hypothetical protein
MRCIRGPPPPSVVDPDAAFQLERCRCAYAVGIPSYSHEVSAKPQRVPNVTRLLRHRGPSAHGNAGPMCVTIRQLQ